MRIATIVVVAGILAGPLAAQCPDGTLPPCPIRPVASRPAAPPAPLSIAVLPFSSRSPDTSQAYLAEGMTDEIANQLTRVARLQVKARTLVAAQWRRTPDPFDAARRLNVAWFVHGSVRQAGAQLLVSVQLVRATTGEESWAQRFPRRADDVFAVQAEVAESVAVQVGGRLNPQDRVAIARRPTRNDEAYRLFLRGNALLKRRTEGEVAQALAAYQEAVRLDPRFADAWARVGFARVTQASWLAWNVGIPPDSLRQLARAAAQRALRLDSLSSEAWLVLATAANQSGDFASARASFERSLGLDSLNVEAWQTYGAMYGTDWLNDYERAEPLLRRAVAIDPDLRNGWRHLGMVLRAQGRFAEAEAVCDTALALGAWSAAFGLRADVRRLRGNRIGATADVRDLEGTTGRPDTLYRALIGVVLGDSSAARAVHEALPARRDTTTSGRRRVAVLAMALGRRADALAALDSLPAITSLRAGQSNWAFRHLPDFIPLRSDPRFVRAMEASRPQVPWSWQ